MTQMSRRSLMVGLGAATSTLAAPRRAGAQNRQITYWGHSFPTRIRLVNEMVPGFRQATGVDVAHFDYDTNQNELRILTSWAGGSGGPDLVSVGDSNLPNYVYRRMITPVDPTAFGFRTQAELMAAYEPGVLDGCIVNGQLYGIPMDMASISMYYRKDFFREAGLDPERPPRTWDEVTEMGKALVKRDSSGRMTRAGWSWLARTRPSHFYYWGTLLPQLGVDFLNANGTANGFNNARGLAAFRYLHDTYHGSRISALGLAPTINPIDDFGAGRAAMINAGLWLAPALEDKYPAVNFRDGVYGIARLPQFRDGQPATRLNTWLWMVSARSRLPKETWQFVAHMTQKPENRALWLNQARFMQPWKGFATDPGIQSMPYLDTFLADLRIGKPMPATPKFAELSAAVARSYDRISANGDRAEQVMPDLARDVDRLLEG
jgi:multiple sugar transport system substrate-binding protein